MLIQIGKTLKISNLTTPFGKIIISRNGIREDFVIKEYITKDPSDYYKGIDKIYRIVVPVKEKGEEIECKLILNGSENIEFDYDTDEHDNAISYSRDNFWMTINAYDPEDDLEDMQDYSSDTGLAGLISLDDHLIGYEVLEPLYENVVFRISWVSDYDGQGYEPRTFHVTSCFYRYNDSFVSGSFLAL